MPLYKLQEITKQRTLAIWHITEKEEELHSKYDTQPDELSQLAQFKFPQKRCEWLAARLLLKLVAEKNSIPYKGVSKNPHGKPLLVGSSKEISITHSYPFVAVIIDDKLPVGIDLEQPKPKLLAIASKFLGQSELDFCDSNLEKLCILWSAKEAMYKIYAKKGLIFNQDMHVYPFDLAQSGTIDGIINKEQTEKKVKLHYHVHSSYVLVYNLN